MNEQTLFVELNSIATQVLSSMDDYLEKREEKKSSIEHAYNNWASELRHPCKRNLVYSRTHWSQRRPNDIDSLYRFKEGYDVEDKIEELALKGGQKIQRAQVKLTWEKYKISGRIDGAISKGREYYPVEIKSIHPRYWDSTETVEEIKHHPQFWIRKIPGQLNIYLLMENKPGGFLILCTFGKRPRILPMLIDYEMGEEDLKTCEFVNAHVDARTLPDRIPYDNSACQMCSFNHLCMPVRPSTVMDISEITKEDIDNLELYLDLKPHSQEFDRLKKRLVGDSKNPQKFRGSNLIIGDIEISSNVGAKSVRTTIGRI